QALAQPGGGQIIEVAATQVTLSLGSGGTPLVSVTQGQGAFVASSAGLAGQLSATVQVTGANFTGTFSVAINTMTTAVNQTFAVAGQQVVLMLPAGPYVEVMGTGIQLSVAGQTLS